jgi:hypothetical protein
MTRTRRQWIGALGIAWLAAYAAVMLAGCPDAADDCNLNLDCPRPTCDAADADPDACGD